jgi:serine/threonine protein kinase
MGYKMETLSEGDYAVLIRGARVLTADDYGPKVLETADGYMVKLIRRKHRLSLAGLFPYAARFARNAERLQELGISTVRVERLAYAPKACRHVLVYRKLAGEPLRQSLAGSDAPEPLLRKLAAFMAELHTKGVYFRSLHLGNILLQPDGQLALIDLADLSLSSGPLSLRKRVRNFRHLLRCGADHRCIAGYGVLHFLLDYAEAAAANLPDDTRLANRLHRSLVPAVERLSRSLR